MEEQKTEHSGYLTRGWDFVTKNPQILYTAFVAIVIVIAFVFVSQLFLDIVVETQERFEKHRLSSMHDAYVILAAREFANADFLTETIEELTLGNETITAFKVVRNDGEDGRIVIASLAKDEIGFTDTEDERLYNATFFDLDSSFSFEAIEGDERFFKIIRAVLAPDGDVLGWVYTETSLSQFDALTRQNVRTAYFILIGIVVVILLLLLRHARIIDYTTLYKRLKEVDQMKDDFISMASHELRSPLTVIRGYADILSGVQELPEDKKKTVTNIERSAAQLNDLVEDMLDVSRIEQGRLKVEMSVIDPKETVSEVVEQFKKQASDKGLNLVYEDADVPTISADPNRLRQILVNLISNAVKYTEKGEVRVGLTSSDNMVTIRISDTGMGMSSEAQKQLFKKFSRVNKEKTRGIVGTGLGLWITAQLIELMHGKVTVESIKGVGSHFIVSFPVGKKPTS